MAVEWNIVDEIRLLRWVAEFKPVGIHKHFHMYCILERMNNPEKYPVIMLQKENMRPPKTFSTKDIWSKLKQYYDLDEADKLENDMNDENYQNERLRIKGDKQFSNSKLLESRHHLTANIRDFTLPWDDYGDLILANAKNANETMISSGMNSKEPSVDHESISENVEEVPDVKVEDAKANIEDNSEKGTAETGPKDTGDKHVIESIVSSTINQDMNIGATAKDDSDKTIITPSDNEDKEIVASEQKLMSESSPFEGNEDEEVIPKTTEKIEEVRSEVESHEEDGSSKSEIDEEEIVSSQNAEINGSTKKDIKEVAEEEEVNVIDNVEKIPLKERKADEKGSGKITQKHEELPSKKEETEDNTKVEIKIDTSHEPEKPQADNESPEIKEEQRQEEHEEQASDHDIPDKEELPPENAESQPEKEDKAAEEEKLEKEEGDGEGEDAVQTDKKESIDEGQDAEQVTPHKHRIKRVYPRARGISTRLRRKSYGNEPEKEEDYQTTPTTLSEEPKQLEESEQVENKEQEVGSKRKLKPKKEGEVDEPLAKRTRHSSQLTTRSDGDEEEDHHSEEETISPRRGRRKGSTKSTEPTRVSSRLRHRK